MTRISHLHALVCALFVSAVIPSLALAATIDETRTLNDFTADASAEGEADFTNPQTLTFDNIPNTPTSNATLTITVNGDFNQANDNVQVEIDQGMPNTLDMGIYLNNVTSDDLFDHGTDEGADFILISSQATIPAATLASMLQDNELVFTMTFGPGVMHAPSFGQQTLELRLQVEAIETVPVPEPAGFALGALAVFGVAALSWRRRNPLSR